MTQTETWMVRPIMYWIILPENGSHYLTVLGSEASIVQNLYKVFILNNWEDHYDDKENWLLILSVLGMHLGFPARNQPMCISWVTKNAVSEGGQRALGSHWTWRIHIWLSSKCCTVNDQL